MKPGDKVVCMDDTKGNETRVWQPKGRVVKGQVYNVEGFVPKNARFSCGRGTKFERLIITGFPVLVQATGENIGWRASRFRPVAEVGHPARRMTQEITPVI